jgi:lipoprotein-anchoring transpeptidase ErfK/SrfK
LRIQISLTVIALSMAGIYGEAAAQTYPPLSPGDYYPAAPAPYPRPIPPGYVGGPPIPPPGGYYQQPGYVYRDARGALVQPYDPGYDAPPPYSPRPYLLPAERASVPPPPPFVGEQYPRPPGDIRGGPGAVDYTGSTRDPQRPAPILASLPPDEQPESAPTELPPQLHRQLVGYVTPEPAGTVVIDTAHTFLYLVLGGGKAIRYGIGVGRDGYTWAGTERVSRMSEWPDWHPPKEMIDRQPYLPRFMAGGEGNPLGARALYLGNTLYRIHGTNQPSTIGHSVSSGCIRLTNGDIEDLYSRVSVGSRVVVLPGSARASAAAYPPPLSR